MSQFPAGEGYCPEHRLHRNDGPSGCFKCNGSRGFRPQGALYPLGASVGRAETSMIHTEMDYPRNALRVRVDEGPEVSLGWEDMIEAGMILERVPGDVILEAYARKVNSGLGMNSSGPVPMNPGQATPVPVNVSGTGGTSNVAPAVRMGSEGWSDGARPDHIPHCGGCRLTMRNGKIRTEDRKVIGFLCHPCARREGFG